MKKLQFVKMHGNGNDFLVTHTVDSKTLLYYKRKIQKLCDRRFGVGGDGVIFIMPSKSADYRMRIFNSDGSEAEMCGNGIRCCAVYIKSLKLSKKQQLTFETGAGIISTEFTKAGLVRVTMSRPILAAAKIPTLKKECHVIMHDLQVDCNSFKITAVSMGNPHAVIYADELTDELVTHWGKRIECHPFFPGKTNVEFIKILSNKEIDMRVWERGCGETLCCGTGACASVVAGIINNLHGNKVTVHLRGGDLFIEWDGNEQNPVFMTGPAHIVFKGVTEI